ncbi:MAG: hypothetical protein GY855_02915, partial [candidate division Zixibacteria bacterium]|nr:hypothetical protein [candidate division Zixibacteria bacterium]
NRLILRYKGDEDDVLQTIEAGNTNLSLPNTKFVGYSQRIRGLFGVKATAKVGGLSLTAIASQEKGNSERTTFEPGTGATMKTIRDYQYAYGRIFDLGRLPVNCEECESNDFDFYPYDTILSIQVYKNAKIGANIDYAAPEADFYVDLDDTTNYDIENGHTHVTEIDPSEYTINPTEHWILFRSANGGSTDGLLGYFMTVRRANGDTVTIGNVTDDIYTLKLIRNNSPLESFVTWSYEWRNVYSLQATNIELEGLEINVFKGGANTESTGDNIDHQNGTKYIQILGLDRTSTSGGANPDNLVDIYNPSVVFQAGGLLIFPDRQPFASENVFGDAQPLTEKVPEIYSNVYGNTEITTNTAYYLQVSNLSRQAEISLNKPNIIENSERITLNGVELVRGEDYRINYDFGRITFDHPDATDPNADISIDFEYTPFITAQKKSLFGIRGEYEFSKNLKLGTTFLYKSDKATERKPKVGQETSRAYVWDADISFKV